MRTVCTKIVLGVGLSVCAIGYGDEPKPQYEAEGISIPGATAGEKILGEVSVAAAAKYLDQGSKAWSESRNCISCHTNGSYLQSRPALTPLLGKPDDEARGFFVDQLENFEQMPAEKRLVSTTPAQIIYLAAGLSEWDAHVTKELSGETKRALDLMFSVQLESGTWGSLDCWPPFESDAYHLATVAAMAAGTAPGWLESALEEKTAKGVAQLKKYLQTEKPLHDYSRLLLLWAGARLQGVITEEQKGELISMVREQQREDGGWSIRSFAAPEAWGKGNRAERLRGEADLANPPSDGHLTGLATLVLIENGIGTDDPAIAKGLEWLKKNQRESGRWWTKSLNTDTWHFITYSGTCYPLMALYKGGALPSAQSQR
ncbi:MAG: hypothetical protein KDA68_01940 [Planctomycetaceae bacterium]|nr:hypothetical protein [Planctomycetaceae bacterium]